MDTLAKIQWLSVVIIFSIGFIVVEIIIIDGTENQKQRMEKWESDIIEREQIYNAELERISSLDCSGLTNHIASDKNSHTTIASSEWILKECWKEGQ